MLTMCKKHVIVVLLQKQLHTVVSIVSVVM